MEHTKTNHSLQLGGALMSKRVVAQLMEAIRSGVYAKAAHLPAELELAEELGVSRTVIRDALSDLEREGYIERVRGIGTVINHAVAQLNYRLDQKFEYNAMIRASGTMPHTDHVQVSRETADAAMAEALVLDEGAPLLRVCKRILAGDAPAIYSMDYLPLGTFSAADLDGLDFTRPIFDLLEQTAHVQVTSTVTHTSAVYGSPDIRQDLALAPTEALLVLEEVSYDRLCRPVMYSRSYYTNYFDFSVLRKKL